MSLPPGHTHESWAEALAARATRDLHDAAIHLLHCTQAADAKRIADSLHIAHTTAATATAALVRFRDAFFQRNRNAD